MQSVCKQKQAARRSPRPERLVGASPCPSRPARPASLADRVSVSGLELLPEKRGLLAARRKKRASKKSALIKKTRIPLKQTARQAPHAGREKTCSDEDLDEETFSSRD